MQSAMVIAYQALIMFILLAVGYVLYKRKLVGDEATRQFSNIAISLINPIVIFNAYQTEFEPRLLKGLLWSVGLAVAAHVIFIIAAMVFVRKGRGSWRVDRFSMIYSNCAFMGIPLIEATFGTEGVFYLTGFITVFNLFLWIHGVILMSEEGKRSAAETAKSLVKIVLSPAILAVVLGLITFFTGLRLPSFIQTPLNYLGAMNTPLAMLVSGATIAKAGLLSGLKCRRIYFVQAFKLLIVPVLLAALFVPMRIFGADPLIINVVLIAAAAPTASATIMFAYKYGRDAEYASSHFAMSTLASIIMMPIVLLVSDLFSRLMVF